MGSLNNNVEIYWKLEGNAYDSSLNGNTGTISNVSFGTSFGKINEGGNFVRTLTPHIFRTTTTLPAGNTDFSVSIWVKSAGFTGSTQNMFVWYQGLTNVANEVAAIYASIPSGVAIAGFAAAPNINTTFNIVDDVWHLLVLTYESATSTVKLYIDNTLQGLSLIHI